MSTKKNIVGVGRPIVEFLGTLRRYPERGERAEFRQFSIQGSGPAATALVALLEWGYPCRILAKVSDDPFGRLIREGFGFEGFDTRGLVTESERVSPFAFVILEEAPCMERTVFHTPGNVSPLEPAELDLSLIDGCSALIVDGTETEAQIAAAERARSQNIPVVFDASRFSTEQDKLLRLSSVLIASERFAAELAPREDLTECLKALQSLGPQTVIITMGQEGAIGIRDASPVRQPILDHLEPLERGGAGHLFFAGVVHSLMKDWPLDRTLRFASAAAGLACRAIGSRAGVPLLAEAMEAAWPEA